DSEKAIVGEILMVDAPLDDWDALDAISEVLDGKVSKRHMSGNRCTIVMTAEKTYIYDLFSEAEGVPVFSDCMLEAETRWQLSESFGWSMRRLMIGMLWMQSARYWTEKSQKGTCPEIAAKSL